MEKTYPKNRIDLILAESIHEDIQTLLKILNKYRGAEDYQFLQKNIDSATMILKNIEIE